MFDKHLQASAGPQKHTPLPWGQARPPAVDASPDSSPASCLSWARSKMYENTLIISSKQLRNKVGWLVGWFYNPSRKKVHVRALSQGQALPSQIGCSVETFVPLLSLLKHHGAHHRTDDDTQERAQQQQKHPPPRKGPTPEVSSGVIHVVYGERGKLMDKR